MKTFILPIIALVLISSNAQAKRLWDNSNNRSLGASVGNLWTIQYQMPYRDNNTLAFYAGSGAHSNLIFTDMLWYLPNFKHPSFSELTPYFGAGAGLNMDRSGLGKDLGILVRAPIGALYHIQGRDMDFFGQIAPQLHSNGGSYMALQLGLNLLF